MNKSTQELLCKYISAGVNVYGYINYDFLIYLINAYEKKQFKKNDFLKIPKEVIQIHSPWVYIGDDFYAHIFSTDDCGLHFDIIREQQEMAEPFIFKNKKNFLKFDTDVCFMKQKEKSNFLNFVKKYIILDKDKMKEFLVLCFKTSQTLNYTEGISKIVNFEHFSEKMEENSFSTFFDYLYNWFEQVNMWMLFGWQSKIALNNNIDKLLANGDTIDDNSWYSAEYNYKK